MLTRRAIAGLLMVIGAVAAAPAHAADSIYWTEPGGGSIFVADPSGAGSATSLYTDPGSPTGLDIDVTGERLIWGSWPYDAIRTAPLDGSGPIQKLATDAGPDSGGQDGNADGVTGVAVDQAGSRVLWLGDSGLQATPLAGGSSTTLYTQPPESGDDLAVDDMNGRVYFDSGVGGNSIYSAPLDGSGPASPLYSLGVDNYAGGIAVDPARGFIYWTSNNEGPFPEGWRIQRAPIDGSGPVQVLYHGESFPGAIAVDAAEGNLYWAEPGADAIRRAPVDGSGPVQTLATSPRADHIVLLRTPLSTAAPQLSGGSSAGSQLGCSDGAWAADVHGSFVHRPPASFAYRWQRDGADIPGADGPTYTASQPGEYRCVVTATNTAGSTEATSAAHTVVDAPVVAPPRIVLGRAYLGRSGSIFVPITCANPVTGHCDTALRIVFRKPRHGFRTITGKFRLAAGASRARITLPRKQRRKLLRIRRQRVTVTLTTPAGDRVSRNSTLSGRTVFRR